MVEINLDSTFPMCFPLCCDIPLPTLTCYLPIVLLQMVRLVFSRATSRSAFLTAVVGPRRWDMLASVYQNLHKSVLGGQPEHQLCFASRRKGCVLLRDLAACFCSAGLSLRPSFTAFNFEHLPGACLSCPEFLFQDYSRETVSVAVNPACWRMDDDALFCIQKPPGLSPASGLSVWFVHPGKDQKHLSLVSYELEVRSSLAQAPEWRSPALPKAMGSQPYSGLTGPGKLLFQSPVSWMHPIWSRRLWHPLCVPSQLKVGGPCLPRSWSTMIGSQVAPVFQAKDAHSHPWLPGVGLIITAGVAMLVSHKN